MNEAQCVLNPIFLTGAVLSALWAGAYISSWIGQWLWSIVDDAKVSSKNWIASLVSPKVPDGWVKVNSTYKYNKYENGVLKERKDNYGAWSFPSEKDVPRHLMFFEIENTRYFLILPAIWIAVVAILLWKATIVIAISVAVLFSARLAMRGYKMVKDHMKDKEAHK